MIDRRTTLIGNDRQKNNTNVNEDTITTIMVMIDRRTTLIGNDRRKNQYKSNNSK